MSLVDAEGPGASDGPQLRAQLRLNFLKCLSLLEGQSCEIQFYDKSITTKTVYEGSDRDILQFCVGNLTTPAGHYNSAVVRANDVDSMTFYVDKIKEKFEEN